MKLNATQALFSKQLVPQSNQPRTFDSDMIYLPNREISEKNSHKFIKKGNPETNDMVSYSRGTGIHIHYTYITITELNTSQYVNRKRNHSTINITNNIASPKQQTIQHITG